MNQPNITQMLRPGGIVPIDIETTAALVAEIKRQHFDLERKDALLRQALDALNTAYGDGLEADKEIESVYESITSELAK